MHLRRLSILFGIIWVLLVLGFTYNESIFPKLWEEGFEIRPKLIESIGRDSYLLANVGILVLLIIEVLIGNAMIAHKRNLNKTSELSCEPVEQPVIMESFFMLSVLVSFIMIILSYLYCRNNSVETVNQILLWSFLLSWIGTLICLKHVVFHNPVKVPIKKVEDRNNRDFIKL